MAGNVVNPFGSSSIRDYGKLLREFGVEDFTELKVPDPLTTMRRGIVFGHRDLKPVLKAMKDKKEFAVMSGIKPSNYFHIGSKMVVDEIVYFQNHGGLVYYTFADVEALADNGLSFKESREYARDNLLDLAALGLDLDKAKVYLQSEEPTVLKQAHVYARNVTNNMLEAIYGEHPVRIYMAALIQVADILLPQLEHGRMPVVVPVGFDQDPHIRLTRDIARKHDLMPPASTYHKFICSLLGVDKKMSKREPQGVIYLNEDPGKARKKIMKYAYSGGKPTVEEHRDKGGDPSIDVSYQYLTYLMSDDKKLRRIKKDYEDGALLSGELKKILVDHVEKFLISHQRQRDKARKKVDEILA